MSVQLVATEKLNACPPVRSTVKLQTTIRSVLVNSTRANVNATSKSWSRLVTLYQFSCYYTRVIKHKLSNI